MKRWGLAIILPPLLSFVLVMGLAEILLRQLQVPEYLLPAPSAVFAAAAEYWRELAGSLLTTLWATCLGFAASAILGLLLAVLLSTSLWVQRAVYPYMIFFQTVPIIAIAPLLVIWLGPGLPAVALAAFIVSIFPVIANSLGGLLSTDPALVDLFRLYGAGRLATLWKLKLPSALPNILTGLRIAAGLAVVGTIVGEFVASVLGENPGLGVLILIAKRQGRTDLLFAAVLAASLLGLILFALVNGLSRLLLRHWTPAR